MSEDSFKQEVEEGLKKLNKEERVEFAWRCGVRALPFLGESWTFDFWEEKERKTYLYSILYALDIAYAYAGPSAANAYAAAADAYAAYAGFAAAYAGFAAAYAAYAAAAYSAAADAAAYSAAAADAAADAAAADAAARIKFNLKPLILNDLKNNLDNTPLDPLEFYGDLWINFQKALEAEDCSYWGDLYTQIFKNGFKVDKEALERRLNTPREIRDQGAAVVAQNLIALEKGATRLNEARIIILGDKGAGKTCLARRLIDPEAAMTTDDESTAGVDTLLWTLEDKDINVRIWDFAGHTVTHAVHQFFLSERCLYLMVYNGRTEEKNSLEYWLNHMKNYGGDSKAIILVNERDLHGTDIKTNFLKEHYPIAGIYHFSLKNDAQALQTFRQVVADYIENNPSWKNQQIASNYYQVKEALESRFSKDKTETAEEHISRAEFDEIADRYEVEDKENLLQSLHCLGVSLWYKEMADFNTLVLNPEWISQGVYKIINWVHQAETYTLALADFSSVFKKDADRFPKSKHKFLFKLMMHYELAYKIDEGEHLIIPHLLQEDRPDSLPDFAIGDSLLLRYKAEQPLPPNTISRFIVRHNQQIKQDQPENSVWRYGVILEDGKGSLALVREDDRTISVSVKGTDKTNYIAQLRETLNEIFNSYKSDKPDLQYRIERCGEISAELEAKYPVWLSDSKILNQSNDNVPYYDDVSRQPIDLNRVVNYFQINNANLIQGQANQILFDQSTHNTFNFYDCNIGLQGDFNELAQLLTEAGDKEGAKELETMAKALEQFEQCENKDEIKKKGIANRLRRLVDELEDKDSQLNKTVKKIKNGVKITQDIAQRYNKIAEWLGMPQIPKPLL